MPDSAKPQGSGAVTRRSWVSWLLGTSLGLTLFSFLYPVLSYLVPPESSEPSLSEFELDLKASDVASSSGRIVAVGGKPVLLLKDASGEFSALSATCTHLDCTVQYRTDRSDIWCACHNGVYDLKGRNLSGPPPRPLTALEVFVRGEKIVIKRA